MAIDLRACLAEAIATFALIFIGAGAVLANVGMVGVALAHGLVLMCMIYATAHLSGAHVNPAVTIGMLVARKIKAAKAVSYVIAQLIGASVAGALLKLIYVGHAATLGTPALSVVSFWGGVIVDVI